MKLSLSLVLLFLVSGCFLSPPTSKKKVEEKINSWYEAHPDAYSLTIEGDEAKVSIERYHPDNPAEKDDLIVVHWKEMKITLAFKKPLANIDWSVEGLQSQFNYVVLDDIYHDIEVNGWDIHPDTPQSSKQGGVTFTEVKDGSLSFEIDWSTYTVFGYSESAKCQQELEIADKGLPEECYVGVRKNLPLKITTLELLVTVPE